MPQVFISYSRKDSAFIDQLVADLQSAGLTVWYDLSGLDGGTQWETEIQGAIEKSQFFLAVLSPNALESKWVVREFLYAEKRGIKIIPVLYLPCELPMRMLDLQLIDLQKDLYSRNFDRLLKALDVPTRADALAKIQAEQQARAASLAIARSEAEEKERIARLENERQAKNEEKQRKQAEREGVEARKKDQKETRLLERQVQLEKEKQEKAEGRVRRQAEKEKGESEARLRRAAAWQNWKPRLPRLAALGILGVLLILAVLWLPELMRNVGANLQPTATRAAAFTSTKPVKVIQQSSATFTFTPTRTPRPTPTATPIPAWVSDFAEPVLNAISDQTPFFQDDFSTINPNWVTTVYNPGVDCSNSSAAISDGKLQFKADSDCYAIAILSSIINLHNFVLQVDMDLNQLAYGFQSGIGIGKYDIFYLRKYGEWEIIDCGNHPDCDVFRSGNAHIDLTHPVTITFISFETRNAIYLNDDPLYYFEHAEPDPYNSLRLDIHGNIGSQNNSADFDNLKIWDLDGIKDLSSLLK